MAGRLLSLASASCPEGRRRLAASFHLPAMTHPEEAKRVSSCRRQRELHPAEASVLAEASRPEALEPLAALDHPEASHLAEPRRLSSFHPRVAVGLPEGLARRAG